MMEPFTEKKCRTTLLGGAVDSLLTMLSLKGYPEDKGIYRQEAQEKQTSGLEIKTWKVISI